MIVAIRSYLVPIRDLFKALLSVQFINVDFFAGQGRTRVCGEAYFMYAAAGNPRRTPPSGKKTICGWTLVRTAVGPFFYKTLNRGGRGDQQCKRALPECLRQR